VGLTMPANLLVSVAGDRTPKRRAWVERLPGITEGLAVRWSLRLGPPFQAGGRSAWVAPATIRTGGTSS
jgi:hypothetical protein